MKRALLPALLVLACATAAAAQDYTRIEGTRVSLRVPDGFFVSDEFPGLGREADLSSVLVSELAAPLSVTRSGFTAEALAEKGVALHRRSEVEVEGRAGLLLHATQNAGGVTFRKWILLLGDERRSALITATAPLDLEAVHQKALVETLSSARWDPAQELVPGDGLRFTVKEVAPLRIVHSAPNAVVLADPTRTAGPRVAPLVVVGSSLGRVQIGDLARFARARLDETVSIEDVEIEAESQRRLDTLPAHEIRARARDVESERAMHVTQLLATDGERYFLLQGIVDAEEREAFAPLLERVIESFALRD